MLKGSSEIFNELNIFEPILTHIQFAILFHTYRLHLFFNHLHSNKNELIQEC